MEPMRAVFEYASMYLMDTSPSRPETAIRSSPSRDGPGAHPGSRTAQVAPASTGQFPGLYSHLREPWSPRRSATGG
jgi:hypothetical protein